MVSKFKIVIFVGVASVAAACGGSDSKSNENNSGTGGTSTGQNDLQILYPKMYSAYDGGAHIFRIPAKVTSDVGTVTWSFEPSDLVSFEPDSSVGFGGIMITTKGAGTVTVTASANGGELVGTATLEITDADPADWELGNTRYNNEIAFPTMSDFEQYIQDDGGLDEEGQALADSFLNKTDWSCANCHGANADPAIGAIEHTPWQTGGYSDDDLMKLITTGTKPPGSMYLLPEALLGLPADQAAAVGPAVFQMFHTWDATEAEKKALVVYLRALTPVSQGDLDFSSVQGLGQMFNP